MGVRGDEMCLLLAVVLVVTGLGVDTCDPTFIDWNQRKDEEETERERESKESKERKGSLLAGCLLQSTYASTTRCHPANDESPFPNECRWTRPPHSAISTPLV